MRLRDSRDYLIGALIGLSFGLPFVGVTGVYMTKLAAEAAVQAPTCTINVATGAVLSGTRQILVSVSGGPVTGIGLTVGGFPVPVTITSSTGSTDPLTPATMMAGQVTLDTRTFADSDNTAITLTAFNGVTQIASLTRVVVIKNAVVTPPVVVPPREFSLSFGFRGNGSAKLADPADAQERLSLEAVTLTADAAATIRLVTGTGPFCGTSRANLTRAYPVAQNGFAVLLPPAAPAGSSICVFFTPVSGASVLVQGDTRGRGLR